MLKVKRKQHILTVVQVPYIPSWDTFNQATCACIISMLKAAKKKSAAEDTQGHVQRRMLLLLNCKITNPSPICYIRMTEGMFGISTRIRG